MGHAIYIYIYSIEFGMLEVREIALRKLSGGAAHLRTLAGTLTFTNQLLDR